MKFQDSSFNGLKVTRGTKSVTHARSKSNMPHQLFQSWGHKKELPEEIVIRPVSEQNNVFFIFK